MVQLEPKSPQAAGDARTRSYRLGLKRIARRQWWLWSSAFLVTLLLALAIGTFAFPELLAKTESSYAFELGQAVRGLIALVLLFNVHAVYQQLQINRMQLHLAEQFEAMDKVEERTEEVYKLAALDPLTGLYNRRTGEQRLAEEISRAQRQKSPLTVLMCDLNGLKSVNDRLGHGAGDEVIRYFARRLARGIRGSDIAVRLGGDEFMVLLPECKPGEVLHILGRLKGLTVEISGQITEPTFSAGWADYLSGEVAEEVMKRADTALYVNKRSAKAQVESIPPA